MKPASYICSMPMSVVAPHTPAWVVTRNPMSRAFSKAAFSGKPSAPVTSKAICRPSMSVGLEKRFATKRIELRGVHPVPGATEVVAVAEHEAARDLAERLQRSLGVVRCPQRVRPVERRRDAGVDRLERAEQVARVDVLGAEDLPVLQVVEDEVLAERPVAAVAAQGGLPHVAVGVDHAGHQDAAARVDLDGALRHRQVLADRGDRVARDQHVAVEEHAGRVDGDHDAVAEHDRPARSEVLGVWAGVGHLILLSCCGAFAGSTPLFTLPHVQQA